MTSTSVNKVEYGLYLKTHLELLYFVGQTRNIISPRIDFDKFLNLGQAIKIKCREELLDNLEIVDEYLILYLDDLALDEIKVIQNFKKNIRSNFFILKCLKQHAIFIDEKDKKVYAVKALLSSFDELLPHFPIMSGATLVPFKDKIIYDGFMNVYKVHIGSNMTQELNELYKNAKIRNRIITTIE